MNLEQVNFLDARIVRIRRQHPERMYFKDIAREEGCSSRTVSRMKDAGAFGVIDQRNKRVMWVYTESYIQYLRTKTVILKASA